MSLNMDRLKSLILYIASSGAVDQLGKTKLYKLIYFIETEMLRQFDRSLSGSEFKKMEHGPVPRNGEDVLRDIDKKLITIKERQVGNKTIHHISAKVTDFEHGFTQQETGVIDAVLKRYGRKSASILSELSHDEPAWALAGMHETLDQELMYYSHEEDPVGL